MRLSGAQGIGMHKDSIEIISLAPFPEVEEGADIGLLLLEAARPSDFLNGDLVVVAQKVVSKAEGAVVDLGTVSPSKRALEMAAASGKDPRLVEVILEQTRPEECSCPRPSGRGGPIRRTG